MASNNFFEIPDFEASTPTEERFAGSDSEDLFMTDIRTSSEASDDVPGSALCTAHRFLKYLPNIELDEIPEDERQCGICQEPYGVDVQDEKIVQLPYCGHRFGSDCIRQWLSPTNIPNRNNCPMCRTELFEIDHSGHTDEDEETDEGVDEDERLQEYIDQVAPELRSLLETGSFANLNAALDYMQNIMRGDAPTPSGMLYSRQVYAVFDFYKDLHTLWPRDSFPAEAGVNEMRRKLLWLMGQLYVRFGAHIDHMSMPIPWRENGPRMCDILDSENMHGMIECGLIQFVSAEEHYNATRRRYNHLD